MDELVSCILSQHTADVNSLPAFFNLKEQYPTWEAVVAAGPTRIADAIRGAGLANQKTRSILGTLEAIRARTGAFSIEDLAKMPMLEARRWLESLPGVGPKTASIVLCFSFGMEAIPVDTHVYRVAGRLGLIPKSMSADRAHDALLRIVPKGWSYRFHMALIQHGRSTCRAPKPRCSECFLKQRCPSAKKHLEQKS
jgi:endonuclease III